MPDKGDYRGSNPSGSTANMSVMSTSRDSGQVGERRALVLLRDPQPWYAIA
jgi:hypothetical protein